MCAWKYSDKLLGAGKSQFRYSNVTANRSLAKDELTPVKLRFQSLVE